MNNVNATIHDILSGRRSICVSLYVAGGIIIATVLLTCCCTLIVRHKCARFIDKLTGRRKKKEKYFASDIEEGWRKRDLVKKKLRKKRKRAPSPDLIETEITAPIVPKEPEKEEEDASPAKCYKCYRKKKRGKRPKRQIR